MLWWNFQPSANLSTNDRAAWQCWLPSYILHQLTYEIVPQFNYVGSQQGTNSIGQLKGSEKEQWNNRRNRNGLDIRMKTGLTIFQPNFVIQTLVSLDSCWHFMKKLQLTLVILSCVRCMIMHYKYQGVIKSRLITIHSILRKKLIYFWSWKLKF